MHPQGPWRDPQLLHRAPAGTLGGSTTALVGSCSTGLHRWPRLNTNGCSSRGPGWVRTVMARPNRSRGTHPACGRCGRTSTVHRPRDRARPLGSLVRGAFALCRWSGRAPGTASGRSHDCRRRSSPRATTRTRAEVSAGICRRPGAGCEEGHPRPGRSGRPVPDRPFWTGLSVGRVRVPDQPGQLDAVHPHVRAPGGRVRAVVCGPVRDGLGVRGICGP